jgi:hypothetical protein
MTTETPTWGGRDPDEAYLLLRGLISLTLAFANFVDIDEGQLAIVLHEAKEAQKDSDGAFTDEEDGINEGVVAVLNSLQWLRVVKGRPSE